MPLECTQLKSNRVYRIFVVSSNLQTASSQYMQSKFTVKLVQWHNKRKQNNTARIASFI